MTADEIKKYSKDIKKSPIFKKVPGKVIDEILNNNETKVLHLKNGEVLNGKGMYVILSGSVAIEKPTSDGRYVKMNIAEAPAPINVAAALDKSKHVSISRMTMESDGCLLHVSGKILEEAIFEGGQFALNITMFLTNRISFLNKRIISLAGYSAASRLTMYLKENQKDGIVEIPMSITDFAEYLGVGRASLYRALDSLEQTGKIRCNGRRIEMVDDE